MKGKIVEHTLQFKIPASTSRGILQHHRVYYILLTQGDKMGIGEVAPLPGLSIDNLTQINEVLMKVVSELEKVEVPDHPDIIQQIIDAFELDDYPAIQCGLETALLDIMNGGIRKVFENDFYNKQKEISINGLIWMGDTHFMEQQLEKKIAEGFTCIKLKIGALDFNTERDMLEVLRRRFGNTLELRLDANGAFSPEEALEKLHMLSDFSIHSIEQPIAQGNWEAMSYLCRSSPIPIALDEELIGIRGNKKTALLDIIKPQYAIFKPTLLGGFAKTQEWITLCEQRHIPWWITSALESNVGLNAICQFAASFDNPLPQGLGTGSLYTNNIASPLWVRKDKIGYHPDQHWNLSMLL